MRKRSKSQEDRIISAAEMLCTWVIPERDEKPDGWRDHEWDSFLNALTDVHDAVAGR